MAPRFTDAQLYRAYNKARDELRELGLLHDGRYLDAIECYPHYSPLAFLDGECARVFDDGVPFVSGALGFEPGHIYVFFAAPLTAYVPGGTLTDVIRHEFGHAWAWLDPSFFRKLWFRETFGAPYHAEPWDLPEHDPDAYVSEYASGQAKEDFAETFMTLLRCRNSLERFKTRPGVYRKLQATRAAVAEAAQSRAGKR